MARIWPCIFNSLKSHKDLTIYYCFFIILFNCHWFVCSGAALSWLRHFICVCSWPPALQSSNCFIQGPHWKIFLGNALCFPGRVLLAMQGLHKAGPFSTWVQLSRCCPLPGFHSPRSSMLKKMNERILTRWTGKQLFNQLCRRRFITENNQDNYIPQKSCLTERTYYLRLCRKK